jgi:hypothetical protein
MIALGAGSPTRAICSTLIAQAFQAINYPILPPIEDIAAGQTGMASLGLEGVHEFAHIRHYSLFAPRDFDISPYFMVVKPTIEACFNHHSVKWSSEKGRIEGEQSELHQRQRTQSHPDEHADGERGLGRVTEVVYMWRSMPRASGHYAARARHSTPIVGL